MVKRATCPYYVDHKIIIIMLITKMNSWKTLANSCEFWNSHYFYKWLRPRLRGSGRVALMGFFKKTCIQILFSRRAFVTRIPNNIFPSILNYLKIHNSNWIFIKPVDYILFLFPVKKKIKYVLSKLLKIMKSFIEPVYLALYTCNACYVISTQCSVLELKSQIYCIHRINAKCR